MTKEEARKVYLSRRNNIPFPEVENLSSDICSKIKQEFNFRQKIVHVFMPIRKNKEVQLFELAEYVRRSGGRVAASVSNFNDSTMKHFFVESDTEFKENLYGIPEPVDAEPVVAEQLDFVFVPLVAIDRNGHRAGYGKGFYDRFLMQVKPECILVGVSFFQPESPFSNIHSFDISMQYCATPERMHRFTKIMNFSTTK